MQANEAVRAMATQIQEARVVLSGCSHHRGPDRGVCSACTGKLEALLKRALDSAVRAGWRGPDVF